MKQHKSGGYAENTTGNKNKPMNCGEMGKHYWKKAESTKNMLPSNG